MTLLYKIVEDDLYFVLGLSGVCVASFDLGLLIGWLMVL